MVKSRVALDHYRAKAAECEQVAKVVCDQEVKRGFAKMTSPCRELAKKVERKGW